MVNTFYKLAKALSIKEKGEGSVKGKKQETQQESGKVKQTDRKNVNKVPDRNKGKELLTQEVSSFPTSNIPKIPKKPANSNIVVQAPARKPTIVGPYGKQVGVCWDDGSHTSVRQILLVVGHCIDSIHIEYDDEGKSFWSQKHGGQDTFQLQKVILEYPDEFLISVSGYYDVKRTRIASLTFHSNLRSYGSYGMETGVYFTFPSTGGKIIGFHGRCNERLHALGAYYEPCRTKDTINELKLKNSVKSGLVVGDSADASFTVGPFGGNAGSPWNDGVYSTIRQLVVSSSDSGIHSIHIEYDKNGNSEWSVEHGERGQYGINKVNLDYPDEFLIGISGFYSSESVNGLTFQTNKETYGPFGKEDGKHFLTPSTGGKIIGLYGHCDANLVSIGAYFEPILYSCPTTQKPMSLGPFGGGGGGSFDDGTFTGVRQITIISGKVIDSISIEYDNNGRSVASSIHGGSGHNKNTITLDYPDEFLISAWGYIFEGNMVLVGSLTFQSNRKTYGPYGTENGKKFSFPSTGGKIIGFHGKCGRRLDAIGAYLEPITHNPPSSSGNPVRPQKVSENTENLYEKEASSSSTEHDEHLSMPSTDHGELTESRLAVYGTYQRWIQKISSKKAK